MGWGHYQLACMTHDWLGMVGVEWHLLVDALVGVISSGRWSEMPRQDTRHDISFKTWRMPRKRPTSTSTFVRGGNKILILAEEALALMQLLLLWSRRNGTSFFLLLAPSLSAACSPSLTCLTFWSEASSEDPSIVEAVASGWSIKFITSAKNWNLKLVSKKIFKNICLLLKIPFLVLWNKYINNKK